MGMSMMFNTTNQTTMDYRHVTEPRHAVLRRFNHVEV